jgi:hypothetical protein
MRASASAPLPGAVGTTTVMARAGQASCAIAASGQCSAHKAAHIER